MDYTIFNCKTYEPLFVAEIDCDDSTDDSFNKRLATLWAIKQNQNLNWADLSEADLYGADLREADLSEADLGGVDLRRADLSRANLSDACLRGADLRGVNLSGAYLKNAHLCGADLRRADLSRANLSDACLRGADLRQADLYVANLCGTDLRDIQFPDYSIPIIKNIHKTIYQAARVEGALDMSHWHSECKTTHCRAGWVIALGGEEAVALENRVGTNVAAALIYQKSDPKLQSIPNWYASDKDALKDMKKCADREAQS